MRGYEISKVLTMNDRRIIFVNLLYYSHNCLLVVDTVASLGAVPFSVDSLKIDVCYSGSQKVLGAPPGLAPITFGPRAV